MRPTFSLWLAFAGSLSSAFITRHGIGTFARSRQQPLLLFFSENNLVEAHDRSGETLPEQRDLLSQRVEDIKSIQDSIESAQNTSLINELDGSLLEIENEIARLTSGLLPPPGISTEDYVKSCVYFAKLPVRIRWALCVSLEIEDSLGAASKWDRVPEIVSRLYTERLSLTPARLESSLKSTMSSKLVPQSKNNDNSDPSIDIASAFKSQSTSRSTDSKTIENLLGVEESEENTRERRVSALLPRVTRDNDRAATEEELQTLMQLLSKELFMVSEKEKTPGGYILRGKNRCKSSAELVEKLDGRLPKEWSAQVSLTEELAILDGATTDPMLLLLKKDISPTTSSWFNAASTASAIVTAFLFSYGVYGGNNIVTSRITDPSFADDLSGFNWFNVKVLEIIVPLFAIQMSHEIGHFFVSKRDGIKTTLPTLLPCWGLPFLGSLTSLRESPKNFTSLFDFAVAGPLAGLIASMVFLITGLQLGNTATPDMAQYFPMLPVNVIKISTLGGSLVDFFAGGEGFITSQDPSLGVPMHPFAIAGFTGLVMNSLELLPLGATDGGRLSLAVFGRKGQPVFGGVAWIFLLFSAFFIERADALIGAWTVYSIAQNDSEIPCRDEITKLDVGRVALAFALWFVAVLTFVPMID
mmetsp:Transcript_7640/g.9998  ORF Transcript_7640/g.9998 Transcript_7640/m.9998 type:complete len:642 (+) Transcript_7640:93-2018(+)